MTECENCSPQQPLRVQPYLLTPTCLCKKFQDLKTRRKGNLAVRTEGASDVVLDIHHGEKRFVRFTMDTKNLDADVNRKHIYGAQWNHDQLEPILEPNLPYGSTLPTLEDIKDRIHLRTTDKKQTEEGWVQRQLNQIETNELLEHLKQCELVLGENAYVVIGNRDHVQASIALMLYCLEVGRPFNLAYFIVKRMDFSLEILLIRFYHII
ncbi:hypothetical protein Tco_1060184 [Tanacetum coccineum]